MARTAKAVTALSRDAGTDVESEYETIDATLVTNGLAVTDAFRGRDGHLVVHIKNDAVADKDVTFAAGTHEGVPGDAELVVTVAADTGEQMVALGDSVLYEQEASEDLFIDFESGMTGSIAIFRVP